MGSMSYPVALAVTKRYVSKFYRGESSPDEVLLPKKSIFCESYILSNIIASICNTKKKFHSGLLFISRSLSIS